MYADVRSVAPPPSFQGQVRPDPEDCPAVWDYGACVIGVEIPGEPGHVCAYIWSVTVMISSGGPKGSQEVSHKYSRRAHHLAKMVDEVQNRL